MTVLNWFEICNPTNQDLIQTEPDAAFNNENFLVVWSDEKYGANYYIAAARVTPGGTVLDTGYCVSSGTGAGESRPKIAFDGTRCLAVWSKSGVAFQARFINSAGLPEGSVISVGSSNVSGAAVAFDGDNYFVVYHAGAWPVLNIYGQFISTSGVLIGNPIMIAADNGDTLRWPDVVFDGNNYLVVWMSGPNSPGPNYIHGRSVTPSGSLIGDSFMISDNTASMRWWPAVSASDSNYLVSWGQGAVSDVYGNIDVGLQSIEKNPLVRRGEGKAGFPTIFTESFPSFSNCEYRIYDVAGRNVEKNNLIPGTYFIEVGRCIQCKVVKIR